MKNIFIYLILFSCNILISQNVKYSISNNSINTKYAELGVKYLDNNNILFSSSKKNDGDVNFIKERRPNNRQLFLDLYKGIIDNNGNIIQSEKFSSEINNKFYEGDITFTPDLKSIYFVWNNYYDTKSLKDSARYKTLYLFKATIDENYDLKTITPVTFNSKNYSIKNPIVSKDGKKLYFSSNKQGGYGDYDIYVADIFENGIHSNPRNLGPIINTDKAELFPFITENNTLYFSSNGHKGKGGLDIFKSEFVNGQFTTIKNLPSPVNSPYDDFYFVLKEGTNSGFFTSNRKGGKGDVDIYTVKID